MAANANGVGVTSSSSGSDSPSLRSNGNASHLQAALVENQSQRARHYGTAHRGSYSRESGYIIHTITPIDTLQGIALKYEVSVSGILRANQLLGNESIHKYKELKIPMFSGNLAQSSPNSSPQTLKKSLGNTRKSTDEDLNASMSSTSSDEEVKRKPEQITNRDGERDISCLLNQIDQQLAVSKNFVDMLSIKNAALEQPPDAYNRLTQEDTLEINFKQDEDSLKDKLKRTFIKPVVWIPAKDAENREIVENEIFEL
jgi:LysM repeat protein